MQQSGVEVNACLRSNPNACEFISWIPQIIYEDNRSHYRKKYMIRYVEVSLQERIEWENGDRYKEQATA